MTWFRVDDGFSDHAKVHALQDSKHWKGAIALWTLAGAWCAKHEKDGFVPGSTIKRLGFATAEADALVECGLWGPAEGGYHFHQWAERNPLRSELDAKREQTRNKVTAWRDRNKKPECNQVTRESVTGYIEVSNHPVTLPPSQTLPRPFPDPSPERESARARPEPVDRLPEPESGFTDRRMRSLFTAEFEAVQRSTPNMGGKQVGELHGMVCRTASLQGVAPETLFVDSVRAWLSNPLTEREQQSPLACFHARWGSLTSRGASGPPPGEPETVEGLRAVGRAAVHRGDDAQVAQIAKRIKALEDKADSQVRRAR